MNEMLMVRTKQAHYERMKKDLEKQFSGLKKTVRCYTFGGE